MISSFPGAVYQKFSSWQNRLSVICTFFTIALSLDEQPMKENCLNLITKANIVITKFTFILHYYHVIYKIAYAVRSATLHSHSS